MPSGVRAHCFSAGGAIEISKSCHPLEQSSFVTRTRETEKVVSFDNGVPPFSPAIEHFHDCVLDGAEPLYTAANAAGTLRAIESVLNDVSSS